MTGATRDDEDVALTAAQLHELKRRLAADHAGRSEVLTWEEVEAELRRLSSLPSST
jgi:putative addiction module component (TIGR02574 family)